MHLYMFPKLRVPSGPGKNATGRAADGRRYNACFRDAEDEDQCNIADNPC